MSVVYMSLYGLQTDEELAMHTLFHGKHALNNSVHAAAQQSDQVKLASGIHSIDANDPLPNTFLRSRVVVELFKIINDNEVFPYTYVDAGNAYSVTLDRPGVIMVIRMEFPRTYTILQPITWTIKSSAEMVF
jgi:hypothetical protein